MTEAEWIGEVVKAFYDKAKMDVLIGYHFRVIKDFDEHIPRISTFWELQLLGKTDKKLSHPFDVMKLHTQLPIKRGEIGRWLVLFKKTLDEKVNSHPQFGELKNSWLTKLDVFEEIFLRFFGFQRI